MRNDITNPLVIFIQPFFWYNQPYDQLLFYFLFLFLFLFLLFSYLSLHRNQIAGQRVGYITYMTNSITIRWSNIWLYKESLSYIHV